MCSDWTGLEQLTEQAKYWTKVHEHLIANTQTGRPDEPRYGLPYLNGDRLMVPDDPRSGPSTSDAWRWYAVVHDRDMYTLVSNGFSRGNEIIDQQLFSSDRFDYVSKYFLCVYLAGSVRRAPSLSTKLGSASSQFVDLGVADGWEALTNGQRHLSRTLNTVFRHVADSTDRRYVAGSYETAPTFYLDKSWYEISRMCADGIPGIDHIPIPGDPGSGK